MNMKKICLIVFVFVLALFACGCSFEDSSESTHPVEKWMSVYDGSIFDFEYDVKKMLHDPSSFEHVETGYIDTGSEVKVRMIFRAKNKLGALVLNEAHGILNTSDGSVSNIRIEGQ